MRRVLALSLLTCASCVQEQRYAIENERVELTADAEPVFVDEEDEIFVVFRNFELQISRPSEGFEQALAASDLPYPRAPWVALHDLGLELYYSLENRGDESVNAMVFLDGRNEFNQYEPNVENADLHQWQRRVLLTPGQRVTGTVTEQQMDEIAVDLSTVVNGAPNSNLVVQFESQSGLDARVRPFIPRIVAGLVGVRAGLQTGRAAPLWLDISLRVRDFEDRAAARGESRWDLPDATAFVPVVPEEP